MSRLDPDWTTPRWARRELLGTFDRRQYEADWSGLLGVEHAPRTLPKQEVAESFARLADTVVVNSRCFFCPAPIVRYDAEWSDATP